MKTGKAGVLMYNIYGQRSDLISIRANENWEGINTIKESSNITQD